MYYRRLILIYYSFICLSIYHFRFCSTEK